MKEIGSFGKIEHKNIKKIFENNCIYDKEIQNYIYEEGIYNHQIY